MTASGRDARGLSDHGRALLGIIHSHYPDLDIASVRVASGQFNDVLIVNDAVVIRFPRTDEAASSMATEIVILNRLRGELPIPIPEPAFGGDMEGGQRPYFMGYRLLAGRPLDRATLDDLGNVDRAAVAQIGRQLGAFLRALHEVPIADLSGRLPLADDVAYWTGMLSAFQSELFQFMRPEARDAVERAFDSHLTGDDSRGWQPVLRHGDFGGTNLLYDDASRRISGVIDFGGAALGDPAVDLAAMTAFHAGLAQAMQPQYPELFAPSLRRRASFYRSTFALQQALWAIRAGDDDEFTDGIAAYI